MHKINCLTIFVWIWRVIKYQGLDKKKLYEIRYYDRHFEYCFNSKYNLILLKNWINNSCIFWYVHVFLLGKVLISDILTVSFRGLYNINIQFLSLSQLQQRIISHAGEKKKLSINIYDNLLRFLFRQKLFCTIVLLWT